MASNTENLNLLMKNPSTDGADTFNVQTMLNENWQKIDNNAGKVAQTLANILKPTTPPIIGLPPSTTPDGMFRALGNTGELHVWRKTEKVGSKGYYLDTVSSGQLCIVNSSAYVVTFSYSSTVSAEGVLTGTVNTVSLSGTNDQTSKLSVLRGKFCKAESNGSSDSVFAGIIYIPNDATFTYQRDNGDYRSHHVSKKQTVVFTDAPTTTTYPVSTNPNAYQEGDDAKAAGYVLGDVVNTTLVIAYRQNTVCNFSYSDALYVADDGSISLANPTSGTAGGSYKGAPTYLSGKFLKFVSISGNGGTTLKEGVIYYIPSNATIKIGSYAGYVDAEIDRYQPVTGYAAIPAGTTIEYLGKFGDKARVQVVSYVGTGTYGESNPNSLTFDFVPKLISVSGYYKSNSLLYGMFLYPQTGYGITLQPSYSGGGFFGRITCKTSGKTVSWYADEAGYQLNLAGVTYTAVAIG